MSGPALAAEHQASWSVPLRGQQPGARLDAADTAEHREPGTGVRLCATGCPYGRAFVINSCVDLGKSALQIA